ncbi:MAG TPA: endonuclease III [Clostridiaceae bacterium]|nr:endonuclease III [Clostridiaceae bacterium]
MTLKERAIEISKIFDKLYPEAGCTLNYEDPIQLLISTQLAAQCTDERVNIVTATLFKKYKDVYDFAKADVNELEEDIKSTGFYRNKARNIIACCNMIIDKFGGKIPQNMEEMLKLPGVGRKTANVVLGNVFGIPGVIVDTHAKRLSNRIGLSKNAQPEKIEFDLMDILPKEIWTKFSNQLVYHGRAVCNARTPKCSRCAINYLCDYYTNNNTNM